MSPTVKVRSSESVFEYELGFINRSALDAEEVAAGDAHEGAGGCDTNTNEGDLALGCVDSHCP